MARRSVFMPSLLLVACLLAGDRARAGERILHEYVPPPGARRDHGKLDPTSPPDWIRTDDQVLPKPKGAFRAGAEERVLKGGRPKNLRMDRTTTHDGVLNYTAEFNPSIVPHKRMTAFDKVGPGYALKVADTQLQPVTLSPNSSPPSRDPFWGSLMLRVKAGTATAIPSVAPGARILSYGATPRVEVTFFHDSADNMWIKTAHSGQLRLVFLTDAPKAYFSPEIPPDVTTAQVPARLQPSLPGPIKEAAARVLKRLKLKSGGPMAPQLQRLVAYYRSFRAGKLPEASESDTYLAIALSQRGVCRHRAFAFTVTAQALGIPTRYVQNEAHAFAEVFVPRLGWTRVDLGGAANELRVHNGRKRAVHRPGPDPFPRPSSYNANGRRDLPQATRVSGLDQGQRQRLARRSRLRQLQGAGTGKPGTAATVKERPVTAPAMATGAPPVTPARPPRKAVTVRLRSPAQVVIYRGETLTVSGQVLDGQRGVAGLQVDILLSRDSKVGYPVGSLVSDGQGRFTGSLAVPRDVEVGSYRVFAETPGDSRYSSSRSQ